MPERAKKKRDGGGRDRSGLEVRGDRRPGMSRARLPKQLRAAHSRGTCNAEEDPGGAAVLGFVRRGGPETSTEPAAGSRTWGRPFAPHLHLAPGHGPTRTPSGQTGLLPERPVACEG